jgi:hypothetical protein
VKEQVRETHKAILEGFFHFRSAPTPGTILVKRVDCLGAKNR